jgi:hypothetical protein
MYFVFRERIPSAAASGGKRSLYISFQKYKRFRRERNAVSKDFFKSANLELLSTHALRTEAYYNILEHPKAY